jgi:hypothetical protein
VSVLANLAAGYRAGRARRKGSESRALVPYSNNRGVVPYDNRAPQWVSPEPAHYQPFEPVGVERLLPAPGVRIETSGRARISVYDGLIVITDYGR